MHPPPLLAPYPPASLQLKLMPDEWQLCVQSWLLLTQQYLLLSPSAFKAQTSESPSLTEFLESYVATESNTRAPPSTASQSLRRNVFLLMHRTFEGNDMVPSALLDWHFLSNLSVTFRNSQTLKNFFPRVWQRHKLGESASMLKSKANLTSTMEQTHGGSLLEEKIAQEMAFSKACYPYSQFLMVGSDLLDSVVSAYARVDSKSLQNHIVALVYVWLTSLMNEEDSRTSTLIDHLYGLRSTPIVKALVENTPFLTKFRNHISNKKEQSGRANPLLEDFVKYEIRSKPKTSVRKARPLNKDKARIANDQNEHAAMHVHKLSLVTQVQDLFPDLGAGFIIKLLDEYGDNTEEVTAHLLDDSLPLHLKQADHSEHFDFSKAADLESSRNLAPKLSPHSTPPLPPARRNIYDNDDLDNLAVNASKLHIGRKNKDLTADGLLSSERPSNQKAAILSALAAFDSDDDERDDTYDAEDVGGTVDNTFGGDDEADFPSGQNDETLFSTYKLTPELFNRDFNTRKSQRRAALKQETGMTDEAIEGWAITLSRDPKRLKHLERMHERGTIQQQPSLGSSSWKADSGSALGEGETSDSVDDGAVDDGRAEGSGLGGRGGRGRGRGGGGRGRGVVNGPANERDVQRARQVKDANKGSRANHNRKDQRTKKMARGNYLS